MTTINVVCVLATNRTAANYYRGTECVSETDTHVMARRKQDIMVADRQRSGQGYDSDNDARWVSLTRETSPGLFARIDSGEIVPEVTA